VFAISTGEIQWTFVDLEVLRLRTEPSADSRDGSGQIRECHVRRTSYASMIYSG
jgi:hypothetical protein